MLSESLEISIIYTEKLKLKKIKKKSHHFKHVYQNYDQMVYSSGDMVCDRRTNGKSDI